VTNNDLLARTCETQFGWLALGNERFEACGTTFVRNLSTPRRHDSNGVGLVRDGSQLDALLQRVDVEYAGLPYRRFEMDPLTPPELAARLAYEGYKIDNQILSLILEGEVHADPPQVDIREVLTEDAWLAYKRLDELWWRESSEAYFGPYNAGMHDELHRSWRLKCPPVRSWQVWVDGGARSYLSSWPGDNGVGMVEDLYTEPEYRRRGLATALLVRAIADARERGAGPVLIGADPAGSPKQLYAALGFRPLFLHAEYLKLLTPEKA
jgi:GNAT superfamily N-acetyltransferase